MPLHELLKILKGLVYSTNIGELGVIELLTACDEIKYYGVQPLDRDCIDGSIYDRNNNERCELILGWLLSIMNDRDFSALYEWHKAAKNLYEDIVYS